MVEKKIADLKNRLKEEDLPAPMTTRELIAELQRLDPTGDMVGAVGGSGRPHEVETSVLYVSRRMRKAGPVVYICG